MGMARLRKLTSWFGMVKVREMLPDEITLYDPGFRSFGNANGQNEFRQAEEWALAEEAQQ